VSHFHYKLAAVYIPSVASVQTSAWIGVIKRGLERVKCIVFSEALCYTQFYRVEQDVVLYWIVSCWAGCCVILNCIVLSGAFVILNCIVFERGVVLYWIVSCWEGRCVILNCIVLSGVFFYTELCRVERCALLYWIVSCWVMHRVVLNCIVVEGGSVLYCTARCSTICVQIGCQVHKVYVWTQKGAKLSALHQDTTPFIRWTVRHIYNIYSKRNNHSTSWTR
jgi:hypothetical protein